MAGRKKKPADQKGSAVQGRDTLVTGQRARFLEHLSSSGNVSAAARHAGLTRVAAYRLREAHSDFAAEWNEALAEAVDSLEAEAWRRGRDGYDEFVTCKDGLVMDDAGRPVLQRRYSDALLTTLLKAHKPEKYRERHDVKNTGNISITITQDDDNL